MGEQRVSLATTGLPGPPRIVLSVSASVEWKQLGEMFAAEDCEVQAAFLAAAAHQFAALHVSDRLLQMAYIAEALDPGDVPAVAEFARNLKDYIGEDAL